MAKKLDLPPCGTYLAVPVYLDRGDYIFQSTGPFYTSWVSEDHDPEWYLDKMIEDNQGNVAVIWDGGASRFQLKSKAYLLDLEGAGIRVPDPDWENGKYLIPEDFEPCMTLERERLGAGVYKFVKEAQKRGLYCYTTYVESNPEWTEKILSCSNFIGYDVGEAFSFASGFKEIQEDDENEGEDGEYTLVTAAKSFARSIRNYFRVRKECGWVNTPFIVTSGSFHLDFEVANGGDSIVPHIEGFAFSHLNFGMSLCRGMYKQCDLPLWGLYIAHEHYAYIDYASPLRFKMLDASFYLSYLNGSKICTQECGSWWQQSDHVEDTKMHQVPKHDAGAIGINRPHDYKHLVPEARKHYPDLNYDSEPCREYRRAVSDFYDYLKKNGTPEGQPEVNFAVLKGRYDFCSPLYYPCNIIAGAREMADKNMAWFDNVPEYGWEIFRRAVLPLNDSFGNYKNTFFSGTPYGLCDIVSLTAPGLTADFLLKNYKALMFTGWNSAQEEDYQLLLDYVKGGGLLFVSIPHLSKNVTRNFVSYGVEELIHGGDFTELAGCRVKGRGKTFYWSLDRDDDRIVPNMPWNRRYGVTMTHLGDLEITGKIERILVDDEQFQPFLFRHKCGKGEVFFMNSWEYPGAYGGETDWAPSSRRDQEGATGEIYRYLAKRARGTAYITDDGIDEVGENCRKITFSYFPSTDKVYVLNCDFAQERTFFLHFHGKVQQITLQPAEFRRID